jgi:diadenosine tetraphosphate (Ap4A) HIT family hydrolase
MAHSCPFCRLSEERIVRETPLGLVFRDAYPISAGHTLIVPRRHIGSYFDMNHEEAHELHILLCWAKQDLDQRYTPSGYNIGVNDGPHAGQTVPHLHIHLIPRYPGDVPDPRGGIRWLMPDRAAYWQQRDR